MDWGKTKSVLIILLIMANVIVGFLYVRLKNEKYYIPEQMAEDVVKNLEQRNISLVKDSIDRKKQSLAIYTATECSDDECRDLLRKAVEKLLGGGEKKAVNVSVPNGISIGLSSDDGRTATLNLSGDMSINLTMSSPDIGSEELLPLDIPKSGIACFDDEAEITGNEKKTVNGFYKAIYGEPKRGMASLGYNCYYAEDSTNSGRNLFCVATVDGCAVPELATVFGFGINGELAFINGKVFIGSAKKAYSETLLDGVNILYKTELNQTSEIISESPAFSMVKKESDSFYLVPSWSVITKDKSGKTVNNIYDSVAGELKGTYTFD